MENTNFDFAKQQAWRNGRTSIIRSLLVIAILVVLKLFVFTDSLVNTFGPYAGFSSSVEAERLYEGRRPWVTTQTEALLNTGYVLSEDGKEKWNFFVFWAEDKYVICRTPLSYTDMEYANFTVKGKLAELDSDYEQLRIYFTNDIANDAGLSVPEAAGYVAPCIILMDHSRIWDQAVFVIMAAVAVLALLAIVRAVRGMLSVKTTKSYKAMAKKLAADPHAMNEQLSREIAAGKVLFKNKWLIVTENWVAETKATNFAIYPKQDVVWIHRSVTQHRTNGIPSGKTHTVLLCTVQRLTITVTARSEKDAVGLMETLQNCGFNAVLGFTPELQQLYNTNMDQFVAIARQQRPPAPQQVVPGYGAPPPRPEPQAASPAQPAGYGGVPAQSAAPAEERRSSDGGAVNIDDYKGPEL